MVMQSFKIVKWGVLAIALVVAAYFLFFGFFAGLYCNRYNHGGLVDRGAIPHWIVLGLYPSAKYKWLARYNMRCAQLVNPNGSKHIEGLIITFYFFDG